MTNKDEHNNSLAQADLARAIEASRKTGTCRMPSEPGMREGTGWLETETPINGAKIVQFSTFLWTTVASAGTIADLADDLERLAAWCRESQR